MTKALDRDSLKREFGLTYQIDSIAHCDGVLDLRGKRVLEIGGALPEELVRGVFGAALWVCVDDFTSYAATAYGGGVSVVEPAPPLPEASRHESGWHRYDGRAQELPACLEGRFDVILSIATLEHVTDMPRALRAMARVLRPGGWMNLVVGPIWSGPRGYHVSANYFPQFGVLVQRMLDHLRPWEHLARTRPEMFTELRELFGVEFAEVATHSIYESGRLNRLFAEEYFMYFKALGLDIARIDPWHTDEDVDRSLLATARKRFPTFSLFEWDGFTCFLQKAATRVDGDQGPNVNASALEVGVPTM